MAAKPAVLPIWDHLVGANSCPSETRGHEDSRGGTKGQDYAGGPSEDSIGEDCAKVTRGGDTKDPSRAQG